MLVYIVMNVDVWNDHVELEGVFSTKEKEDCFIILERELDA